MLERMNDGFRRLLDRLEGVEQLPPSAVDEYTAEAMRALDAWHAAERYFNSITDPDLIEYALYEVEAARRKYEYLMRKLRNGDALYEDALDRRLPERP